MKYSEKGINYNIKHIINQIEKSGYVYNCIYSPVLNLILLYEFKQYYIPDC